MNTNEVNAQERTARERLGSDCFFIGETADGTAYYWSTRRRRLLAVDTDLNTDTIDLAANRSLGELVRAIGRQRGWATRPRVNAPAAESIRRPTDC